MAVFRFIMIYLFSRIFRVVVFNATFSNISVISWRSVLLVEETENFGGNRGPAARNRVSVGACDVCAHFSYKKQEMCLGGGGVSSSRVLCAQC